MRTRPGFSSSPTGAQTILSIKSASSAATWGTGSSHARASKAADHESSRVALTPFSDVDDQRDASVKRASFVEEVSSAWIAEFSLSSPQGFFAEGPPSVLLGRGPPSGIFVALIDDARCDLAACTWESAAQFLQALLEKGGVELVRGPASSV